MKYIQEYRDQELLQKIINQIRRYDLDKISLMEFCGGHTVAILRYGIRQIMPAGVKMLSGPGCPICVTDNYEIDKAIEYASLSGVVLITYGDMLRVPGSYKSLSDLKAEGANVEFVYSPLDALKAAMERRDKKVIFFGVGFETSAPAIAATILEARKKGINNFYVYSAIKLTPPAVEAILSMGEVKVNGILGPGHVSTVIGYNSWKFVSEDFRIPFVVSGFEPFDILLSLKMLLEQIKEGSSKLENEYTRSVSAEGNLRAKELIYKVFEVRDGQWRGLGKLPSSVLKIKKEFEEFDAEANFKVSIKEARHNPACKCAEVLRGVMNPMECSLFKKTCTPYNPMGPCMVSSEGSCAAYYHYGSI